MAAPNVGRLRPVGFAKRTAGVPTTPIVAGTFIDPTLFPRYIPPWNWNPEQPSLESTAHDGAPEIPSKADKGPGSLNGKKLTVELEPTHECGNLIMAGFGVDTVTGDGVTPGAPHAHNFSRLDASQLPVYDFWDNGGAAPAGKQNGFAAMMSNFVEFQLNKADWVRLDTEWTGMFQVPLLALTPVVAPPPERPLHFAQVDFYIGASALQGDVQVFTVKAGNQVVADHALRSDTNFPMQIWSEGQAVDFTFETILTDVAEYNKFRAAATTTIQYSKLWAKITSGELFTEGALDPQAYNFEIQLPSAWYRTGEIQYPTGVVRCVLAGGGLKADGTIGTGGNAYTWGSGASPSATPKRSLVVQYVNGVATPY